MIKKLWENMKKNREQKKERANETKGKDNRVQQGKTNDGSAKRPDDTGKPIGPQWI